MNLKLHNYVTDRIAIYLDLCEADNINPTEIDNTYNQLIGLLLYAERFSILPKRRTRFTAYRQQLTHHYEKFKNTTAYKEGVRH